MCFRGGGVGHRSTRQATDFFKKDHDHLDRQTVTEADEDNEEEEDLGFTSGAENIKDKEEEEGYNQNTDSNDEPS